MPLVSLIFRCPRCGQDPMEGEGDDAWCPDCGARFSRGGPGGGIRVTEPGGGDWEVPTHALTALPEEVGAFLPVPPDGDGRWFHSARAELRRATGETAVRFKGELIGLAEVFGPPELGLLEAGPDSLTFRHGEEGGDEGWRLLDVRAVQTSSSAVQFAHRDGALVQFRFIHDSPRRWEGLLRAALRALYRREGRGEIVEFQPRIVAEP